MNIQFWGAAREVPGSMHLLEVGGRRILLDCGMYQGRRKHAFERNRNFPFEPSSIDAVVLSHAHIDHCGNLPTLVRAGFGGKIYATPATRDLCRHMLVDSAHIQKSDVRYVNRRRKRQGKRPFEPLYMIGDARKALSTFRPVHYGRTFEPAPGVRATFIDAGHILGSASVVLDLTEGSRTCRLVFSGDIGRKGLPILRDPQIASGADYVIMESTYGNREHEPPSRAREYLRECAESTCASGGKLLVPSFALGRTQEVVYRLNQLWEDGELPAVDVFVDSPLAINVTEVYGDHPECYDREMLNTMATDSDGDPLGFRRLRYVRSAEESKALNMRKGPAIIIAASGMCEGGRILHHLRNHVGNPNTTVLFVGYQAQHTLGRRLLEGNREVRVLGAPFEVRARVERADSYSAHADRTGLLGWAEAVRDRGQVTRFFLVHGEADSAAALASDLRSAGTAEVEVPERGAVFELD
jgi:metallo-beta-lactamase family protein